MAKTVEIRAHGSLRDFLTGSVGHYSFDTRALAKDAVESLGIPHPEVDLLLANGESIAFNWDLEPGAKIDAYPKGHAIDKESRVRPPPLKEMKFLVDENLGKLATFLLILGLDVKFDPGLDDPALAKVAAREARFLLTRDIGLLKRSLVTHGYWVRNSDPKKQISEVIRRCGIWSSVRPFTRCLECNVELREITPSESAGFVPPVALHLYDQFFRCDSCRKVFWKGSHFDKMQDWLARLREEFDPPHAASDPLTTSLS